jgi:hypothetical protein
VILSLVICMWCEIYIKLKVWWVCHMKIKVWWVCDIKFGDLYVV